MEPRKIYLVPVFLMVLSVRTTQSMDFWEFMFGPRLGVKEASPDFNQQIPENLAKGHGYRLDTHQVASETGHILTLHRIPRGRKPQRFHNSSRPIAFIHHGLFGSSDMWLLRGPQHDLPYLLADAGYDVWLFNMRGNVYSRRHKTLNPDKDIKYWMFGIEETGSYDLPVTVDYVLNITGQEKMYYLGHSVGVSSCLILCSLKPEYNEKIKLIMGLGPLATVKHTLSPIHKLAFSLVPLLADFLLAENIFEIVPRRPHFSKLAEILCQEGAPTQELCLTAIYLTVGGDTRQLNKTSFPNFVKYYPAGTSSLFLINVMQYYLSGNFARYDYGSKMLNVLHYNSTIPPVYNLSKVVAPVSLHFGRGDFLVTEKDIDVLATKLPNVVGKFPIPYKNFNHLDFVLAKDSRTLLYDSLLTLMEKFK